MAWTSSGTRGLAKARKGSAETGKDRSSNGAEALRTEPIRRAAAMNGAAALRYEEQRQGKEWF